MACSFIFYAEGYIFRFFIYSVMLMKIKSKFCVKVSQMGISQQPLIRKHSYLGHGYPRGVCLHSMNFGPRVHASGWGWR